jgi:hypothetical protein
MRQLPLAGFGVVVLLSLAGCPLSGSCTLKFVPDSLTITFNRPIVGPYTASVTTGGHTYLCDPAPDGGARPGAGDTPSMIDGGCRAEGMSIGTREHRLGDKVTVVLMAEERTIMATLTPKTMTSEPNGEGCGEVKSQTATLNVD